MSYLRREFGAKMVNESCFPECYTVIATVSVRFFLPEKVVWHIFNSLLPVRAVRFQGSAPQRTELDADQCLLTGGQMSWPHVVLSDDSVGLSELGTSR